MWNRDAVLEDFEKASFILQLDDSTNLVKEFPSDTNIHWNPKKTQDNTSRKKIPCSTMSGTSPTLHCMNSSHIHGNKNETLEVNTKTLNTVDSRMVKNLPHSSLRVDTKSSPVHQFGVVSPSPTSSPLQHPFLVSQFSLSNDEDSIQFPSLSSQSSSNTASLNISKRLHLSICKLIQRNQDLQTKLDSLQNTDKIVIPKQSVMVKKNTTSHCHSSDTSETFISSSLSSQGTVKVHEIQKESSPQHRICQDFELKGKVIDIGDSFNDKDESNEAELKAQNHLMSEKETKSIDKLNKSLKEKDTRIHALESELQTLESELEDQKQRSDNTKKHMESVMADSILEIRQGYLSVLMNTKKQVHDLLREVEEYKLRCIKMETNKETSKANFAETLDIIDTETTELQEHFNEKCGTIEKSKASSFDHSKCSSTLEVYHIATLNKKIKDMGEEIERLKKLVRQKQDVYTCPAFGKFDQEDFDFFEVRDDFDGSQEERKGSNDCLEKPGRECTNTANDLSFVAESNEVMTPHHIEKLKKECSHYKEEALYFKSKMEDLAEENKECLERLASVGMKLSAKGGLKWSKKSQKNKLLAVAKAAGDLESIRKSKEADEVDSLTNHTGHSGSETECVKAAVIQKHTTSICEVEEVIPDASEVDSLLTDDRNDVCLREVTYGVRKKKSSTFFGKRKKKRQVRKKF